MLDPLPKEAWLHACAVVDLEEFPGLAGMILSCCCYEEMLIKELKEKGRLSIKYKSLIRAWVCVFFEVLRVMYSKKYKKCCSSCLTDRMGDIGKIKKKISALRESLSKLKQNEETLLIDAYGHPFTLKFVPRNLVFKEPTREVNIQKESENFLLILSDCEVPKANRRWFRRDTQCL